MNEKLKLLEMRNVKNETESARCKEKGEERMETNVGKKRIMDEKECKGNEI